MLMKTLASVAFSFAAVGAQAQLPEAGAAALPGSFLQVAADVGHRVIALVTDNSAGAPSEKSDVQNIVDPPPPPVPEPETYALMAAGLAALAFVVRRRKS